MNVRTIAIAAGLLIAFGAAPTVIMAQRSDDSSLADAVIAGEAHVSFRFRFEHVDQDNFSEDANASTVRLRLDYETASWRDWSGFIEFDYIGELLFEEFNSLGGSSPDRNQYPVVADPKGPDLNQLYVDFKLSAETQARAGRERIVLDNQRFVGDVGWRQNTQTYDALGFSYSGWQDTEVFYRYVTTVRTVLGDNVPAGSQDNDTHLLNVSVKLADGWAVIPYLYYIDNDDVAAFSTATFGARATGTAAVPGGRLDLVAELATQSDAAANPVSYDTEYWHIGATWSQDNSLSLGLAFESLGGNQNVSGASFRTPLATLHAFQGWADQFVATPGAGLNDFYATVKYDIGSWTLTAIYHDFSAEAGNADWGSELDFAAARNFADRYALTLKAAVYDADQHAADTSKFWIMLTGNY